MSNKHKGHVYGKKKKPQEELEDIFASLDLNTSSPENRRKGRPSGRRPLKSVSSNAGPEIVAVPQEKRKALAQRTLRTRNPIVPLPSCTGSEQFSLKYEISVLTSLEHVKDEVHDFEHTCRLWAENYKITKIAQGGFAAIFRLQLRADTSKYVIAKLMPLKPRTGKGSRAADQTSIQDAATEVKALDAMSEVPGFVGFSEAWVLRGALPSLFKKEYRAWAKAHPEDGFTGYPKEQLWCFIEMSDAGTDLEQLLKHGNQRGGFPSNSNSDKHLTPAQCWDIFWGIAEALGRGEEFSEFEHRDLHPGNVCIKEAARLSNHLNEPRLRKRHTTLEVTLIDYTLSRATLANGEVLVNLMRDKSIFEQHIENPCTQQEQDDNQQYEIYRNMRGLVTGDSLGCKDEAERWQDFVPQTNTLWLHHILSILVQHMGTDNEASKNENRTKVQAGRQHLATKTATRLTEIAEGHRIEGDLKKLMEGLDPKQQDGSRWGSAKALLECEQFWAVEGHKVC